MFRVSCNCISYLKTRPLVTLEFNLLCVPKSALISPKHTPYFHCQITPQTTPKSAPKNTPLIHCWFASTLNSAPNIMVLVTSKPPQIPTCAPNNAPSVLPPLLLLNSRRELTTIMPSMEQYLYLKSLLHMSPLQSCKHHVVIRAKNMLTLEQIADHYHKLVETLLVGYTWLHWQSESKWWANWSVTD